ncbi:class I SAM-dependent methyltransferase [Desulfoluna spongiiphila]|uniref:Methyltransferase domain-containing protein n=1 Tax=Desulfoluna spongiiphila TaxID=419481 RepID=A0A1G5JHA6_9BACT|nr:class I SAM-dependent methyltransferase [Desulfoluna spongiiphila]SCY87118.1 Methyltransferase domain-containing protein [Desulfoluna spongiiphila]
MNCRYCNASLEHTFIDLVNAPASNSFLSKKQLNEPENFYPLKLFVCHECHLVQIDEYKKFDEIFNQDYAYFSSFSKSWLTHAKLYVEMITSRLELGMDAFVVEIASNDGYLLQYFMEKGVSCLGVEPSKNTAAVARAKGIESITEFFGVELATKLVAGGKKPDLILGNNVLAHVPDINDFVEGMKILLGENGTITMEFPHLMQLVKNNQFDTIYHEHFSYLAFHTVQQIFNSHDLTIFDVEEISTHGGSLRIYARHTGDGSKIIMPSVVDLESKEIAVGMSKLSFYTRFQQKAERIKYALLEFLIQQKRAGFAVVAYGAAAKGNTLLNYCGIKNDLISFVVDASPHKQGKYLPGSRVPVVTEDSIKTERPDYVLILPWNIRDEISDQLRYIRDWGGKFVTAVPELRCW